MKTIFEVPTNPSYVGKKQSDDWITKPLKKCLCGGKTRGVKKKPVTFGPITNPHQNCACGGMDPSSVL